MSFDPTDTERATEDGNSRSSRRAVLAITVAILAIVSLGAIFGHRSASATACSRCHTPQAQALEKSVHSTIACRTCHFAENGPVSSRIDVLGRMVPRAIGGVELDRAGRLVSSEVCIDCHDTLLQDGVTSANGLRINHKSCAVGVACESCHTQSIHGTATRYVRAPMMADCLSCHAKKSATVNCDACHDGKLATDRARDPEWARAHGPEWKTLHGTGDLASCVGCHTPTSCAKCHGINLPHPPEFGTTHGTTALKAGVDRCRTCHKRAAYCDGCHGMKMPHPSGFLQTHSTVASSLNDPRCVKCHVVDDCQTCHTYHIHPGGTQPPVGRNGNG